MVRVLLQRRVPVLFRVVRLIQVQEGEGPVVQVARGIRDRGIVNIGIITAGFRPVNALQPGQDGFKAVRSAGQAAAEQGDHFIRDGAGALPGILREMLLRVRAGCPEAPAGVHFQDGQRPGVDVHPSGRFLPGGLLRGTVGGGIAGGLCGPRTVSGTGMGAGQPEVSHLRVPAVFQQEVAGLHILVNQAVLMGILQAFRGLDRDGQDPLPDFPVASRIQGAVLDPVAEASVVHPLGEDGRDAADFTHVVAGHNVRMQAEADPVFALFHKLFFPGPAALGKELRLRPLHGQVRIPAGVMNAPDAAHASDNRVRYHPVGFQDPVAFPDLFVGNGVRFPDSQVFQVRRGHLIVFKDGLPADGIADRE